MITEMRLSKEGLDNKTRNLQAIRAKRQKDRKEKMKRSTG